MEKPFYSLNAISSFERPKENVANGDTRRLINLSSEGRTKLLSKPWSRNRDRNDLRKKNFSSSFFSCHLRPKSFSFLGPGAESQKKGKTFVSTFLLSSFFPCFTSRGFKWPDKEEENTFFQIESTWKWTDQRRVASSAVENFFFFLLLEPPNWLKGFFLFPSACLFTLPQFRARLVSKRLKYSLGWCPLSRV